MVVDPVPPEPQGAGVQPQPVERILAAMRHSGNSV